MRSYNKASFNSWKHPLWKFGCLWPIVFFVGLTIIVVIGDVITGNIDQHPSENQVNLDSLAKEVGTLAFEGMVLNSKFNKKGLSAYNLQLENGGSKDSCTYVLRHKDYFSGHNLNSNQNIYVYTTDGDSIYQILITMKNDDVYTDAFFEKYGIENASKVEYFKSIIWTWKWKNQMLALKIPTDDWKDLEIQYLDFDVQKRWVQFKQSEHDAEINALMRDKEDSKANI